MRAASKRCVAIVLAAVSAALTGCATAPSRVDPLDPFNRAMFSVHEVIDGHLIKPIAQGYVRVTPDPIRQGVSNFFGNIDDLFTGVNNVLEGNGKQAGDDFGRVLLNSTFGVGGIFDLATMAGIEKDKKDFGITFGKWGIPNGAYLFIPLLGPSTVRDSAGLVARAYSNPLSYIPDVAVRNTIYGVNYLDTRAQALPGESVLETASIDKYRYLRSAYLRARRYKVFEGKPPPEEEDENQ